MVTLSQEAGSQGSESENVATGLHIRLLEERDTARVREIIKQLHAVTVFRSQEFSDRKLNEYFRLILTRPPRMIAPVAIWNGSPVGGAWAIADSYMLSDGPLFVTVHVIAVDLTLAPTRRAKVFLSLVGAIRGWAEALNASHSFIHVITGSSIVATDRLMTAAGASFVGGAYVI
ncbi:GNAT family N-acetyltransferase [Agrobacterium sp. 22-223-1]